MTRYIIGLTGASGVIYGIRLAEELLKRDYEVHLIASDPACLVIEQELGWDMSGSHQEVFQSKLAGRLVYHDNSNLAALPASGSFRCRGMVIIPCTMATASAVAIGSSRTLMERTADVMLKEKLPLLIVPRETPLNTVHLRNLLSLAEMGVHVIPAMPAFYSQPATVEDMINFVIGKVLDAMQVEHELFKRYSYND